MEITGKVVSLLETITGVSRTGNQWQKKEFVIETVGQYPKKVCFTLFGDKVSQCPKEGQICTVSFDVKSNEYNGKWFTNLEAWKVTAGGAEATAPSNPQAAAPSAPQTNTQTAKAPEAVQNANVSDLPF